MSSRKSAQAKVSTKVEFIVKKVDQLNQGERPSFQSNSHESKIKIKDIAHFNGV